MAKRIMIETLEQRRLLSGVTVITHGYEPLWSTRPSWLDSMATSISNRIGSAASVYALRVNYSGSSPYVENFSQLSGPSASSNPNGEKIVLLDWAAASGIVFSYFPTDEIAALVEPYFTQPRPTIGLTHPLSESPIHLIGHSRGGSLMSVLAADLGNEGLWVDQLTTLDPHPVSPDPLVNVAGNVVFADNYFETTDTFAGSTVSGAHNVNLTSLGLSHTQVHEYYDATIGSITTDGYAWSRIGGSTRPSDGLSPRTGWSVTSVGSSVWDNVVITSSVPTSITRGTTLNVQTKFQDANKDATLSIGFDSNANPDDAPTLNAVSWTNTGATTWNAAAPTSSLSPGTYRVFAKITNNTNTRYYYAPGTVTITPETTEPTATATAANITAGGATSYNFSVTYSDNIAIKASTIDSSDIVVTGPGGFSTAASLVSVNTAGDGTPRTAYYKFTPRGGAWNSADNGAYTLTLQANQITDTTGNAANSGALKSFTVSVPPPPPPSGDTTKPTASASISNVTSAGATSQQFTVTYADNVAINASTIDGSDIRVTGPNGFTAPAALVSVNAAGDGTPRTAKYQFTPPGNSWNSADNGTYTLALQASQISDTSNNFANAASLKTFSVSIVSNTPGIIAGAVFIDSSGDGIQNRNEHGTTGWTLWLDLDGDAVVDSGETQNTNSLGSFAFTNVAPGTYVLRLLPRTGWTATTRTKFTITVASGQTVSKIAFGQH